MLSACIRSEINPLPMTIFEAREKGRSGALISLPELLARMPRFPVALWAFRQVDEIRYPLPFGMEVAAFERLTKTLSKGFMVGAPDFELFLKADFQIIDGSIDAYSASESDLPMFSLECIDSSCWEIAVHSPEIAQQFEQAGFARRAF